ncbi:unnamed protein product [Nezara viridula]|uniref:Uncharacterized protein n=1 Tax=Nezara viridula TaxID=85310 RepID=A0A9P0H516_NEZVI|nr:unnamed protein product [Nezara viridula]
MAGDSAAAQGCQRRDIGRPRVGNTAAPPSPVGWIGKGQLVVLSGCCLHESAGCCGGGEISWTLPHTVAIAAIVGWRWGRCCEYLGSTNGMGCRIEGPSSLLPPVVWSRHRSLCTVSTV